jgi:hypothetical protein
MHEFETAAYKAACDPKLKGKRIQVKSFQVGANWAREYGKREYDSMLNFCAGLISTMDQFSEKHPEEVRDWILAQAAELKVGS